MNPGNFCTLAKSSPFFPIFRDGKAPIKNALAPAVVILEGDPEKEAYLLDWPRCSIVQRTEIAAAIARVFRKTNPTEFKAWMDRGGDLPIRVSQTTAATLGADLRLFV
ncbi:MAG: hypothetical protein M3Y03_04785 [Verrucomicrobiota bacterium]|nr:hypothetical protein [Verrucomicrobiota bacterium]